MRESIGTSIFDEIFFETIKTNIVHTTIIQAKVN